MIPPNLVSFSPISATRGSARGCRSETASALSIPPPFQCRTRPSHNAHAYGEYVSLRVLATGHSTSPLTMSLAARAALLRQKRQRDLHGYGRRMVLVTEKFAISACHAQRAAPTRPTEPSRQS